MSDSPRRGTITVPEFLKSAIQTRDTLRQRYDREEYDPKLEDALLIIESRIEQARKMIHVNQCI